MYLNTIVQYYSNYSWNIRPTSYIGSHPISSIFSSLNETSLFGRRKWPSPVNCFLLSVWLRPRNVFLFPCYTPWLVELLVQPSMQGGQGETGEDAVSVCFSRRPGGDITNEEGCRTETHRQQTTKATSFPRYIAIFEDPFLIVLQKHLWSTKFSFLDHSYFGWCVYMSVCACVCLLECSCGSQTPGTLT